MPNQQKAAIYCRVSTVYQQDKASLPMQRSDMANYAQYILGIDYEIFEDVGYSGKNTERPAFRDMMERIQAGEFSHILVWKIDRISRNLLDFSAMYARCKKLGVVFISKNEQFDTSTAMGEAMLKIILVFAELERNMTSERVQATMNSRAAEGKWNGGRVPFGYAYDKATNSFRIVEKERQDVILLKDLYLSCHSIAETARRMNSAGKRTRRGYQWTPATVSLILRSPFYRGTYRYNYRDESEKTFSFKDEKEWILYSGHHPAIFSEEDIVRIDEWLEKNRNSSTKGRHSQRRNVHIFSNLIYCGQCGSKYYASKVHREYCDGYYPSMYLCVGRRHDKESCWNKWVMDVSVGTFIFSYISNILALRREFTPNWNMAQISGRLLEGEVFSKVRIVPSCLEKIRQTLMQSVGISEYHADMKSGAEAKPKVNQMQEELDRNVRAMERLNEAYLYADEVMPQLEYLQKRKELQEKIDRIRQEMEARNAESIIAPSLFNERFVSQAAALVFRDTMEKGRNIDFPDLAQTVGHPILKDFVNTVISRITVSDGQVTAIEFKNGQIHSFLHIKK